LPVDSQHLYNSFYKHRNFTQASSTQLSRKSSCFLILQHEVKDDGLKSIAKVLWTFVRFFDPVIALVDLATDATDGKSRRNSEWKLYLHLGWSI